MIGLFCIGISGEKRFALTYAQGCGFAVFSHELTKLEKGFVWCGTQTFKRFMRLLWNTIARTLNLVRTMRALSILAEQTQATGQKRGLGTNQKTVVFLARRSAAERTRTFDRLVNSQLLYLAELRRHMLSHNTLHFSKDYLSIVFQAKPLTCCLVFLFAIQANVRYAPLNAGLYHLPSKAISIRLSTQRKSCSAHLISSCL